MEQIRATLDTLSIIVMWLALFYFAFTAFAGFHELRKRKLGLNVQGDTKYTAPFTDDQGNYDTYVLIPCLNESAVIGATVAALRNGRRNTTIVIDDGSDDNTAECAERAGDGSTMVLRRTLPHARQGKGEALNAAFVLVRQLVAERHQDPAQVIVVVMDADGRLSDGAFMHKTGTVSLGGNGQFTRFTALDAIGDKPWSESLTEDLDLAVTLLTHGWRLDTTPNASVDQQAVTSVKRLFNQRRRWYQGHMTDTKRIPEILSSPKLSAAGAIEVCTYLLVPWVFDLPWSILWQWNVFLLLRRRSTMFADLGTGWSAVAALALWYLITFAPVLISIVVYLRRDRRNSIWQTIVLGHSFIVMNYLAFACTWAALYRIIRKKRGWDKTSRAAEPETALPQETPVPVTPGLANAA